MRSFFLLITISLTISSAFAKVGDRNCFSGHIKEAIEVNKNRLAFYSALTNGQSDKIFRSLIRAEYLALPVAKIYDFRVRKYQDAGIPIFCKEFQPMIANPDWELSDRTIPSKKFSDFEWRSHSSIIRRAVIDNDLEKIKSASWIAVSTLKKNPSYHCMVRHIFESIYRFAHFIPEQEEMALREGMKSPRGILLEMIRLQLLSLKTSSRIDKRSAPIHEKGIPVLCAELPDLLYDLRQ